MADADEDHPRTLVFFDLDGFKRYNDTFGHAAGDSLLARLGAALSACVGDHGRAYRLGGDEFCLLLVGRFTTEDSVIAAGTAALTERGNMFSVSASHGLAVVPDEATTTNALLQLADQRMYAAKVRTRRSVPQRTHDVLMQVLSERTPDLHFHVHGVGQLVGDVGRTSASMPISSTNCCAPPSCMTSASSAFPTPSWTSPPRSTRPSGS